MAGILNSPMRERVYFPLAELIAGRKIRSKMRDLAEWQNSSPQEKQKRYAKALGQTIEYAGARVPYYRDLFRRINFQTEKIYRDVAWINEIPYLTKEIVRMQPERFVSDDYKLSDLAERKTSGSTGLTLSFYYSRDDLDIASAVLRHFDKLTGNDFFQNEVHLRLISPRSEKHEWRARAAERIKNHIINRSVIELIELNHETSVECLEQLRKISPYFIYSTRSSFESVLRIADNPDLARGVCSVYVNSGETLDRRSADYISIQIGCKVINRYGNAEFGAVAQSQTDVQSLRFVDGIVWPENFTIEGMREIVLTTLAARAMPLIRYRTGDLGEVSPDSSGGFSLNNVIGRLHDLIHVGQRVFTTAYLSDLLSQKFDVHDFQILSSEADTSLEFRVVLDCPENMQKIGAELQSLLGVPVKMVRIRISDLIRRGRQMKFSHVVQGA